MHQFPINASIQLIPIDAAENAMPQIDKAIALIQQSGLHYEVGPFGTTVEGGYEKVGQLITAINNMMNEAATVEWVLNVQFHIKPEAAVTMQEKVSKHR
ncbi:MAG TPA: thiamine-binding protein [Phnomibacter sp.]|nr:thiamine-binding protein [Phnomibacter sp.]